ncbi:MAG: recombination mediator RecR [Calditrichia bacterium]
MIEFPKSIQRLIDHFSRLPGIGRKTATRLVLFLLKQDEEHIAEFADALLAVKREIYFCKFCHHVTEKEICEICSNPKRDRHIICVVQDFTDIFSIENSGEFNGLYHVLGGLISPLEGVGPSDLHIQSLLERIDEDVQEVVLALDPSNEGEVTMVYLAKLLKEKQIKVTYLARGIPMGTNLQFIDNATLGQAFQGRREI